MRTIELSADQQRWLLLPPTFPTAEGESAQQWEDRVVDGMREAWRGTLTSEVEPHVRAALRFGCSKILPEDSVTLQFWPAANIANVVVHIGADETVESDLSVPPLDTSLDYVTKPIVTPFEAERLGTGVEVRHVRLAENTDPPLALAGVNYRFASSTGEIVVVAEPTFPALLGLMLEPLREVVRSMWVSSDDSSAGWVRSTIDVSAFSGGTDEWQLDDAVGEEAR